MGATRFPGLAGREKNKTFVRAELGKFFYCNFFAVVLGTVSTGLAPNRLLGSLISEVFGISTALSSQSFTRHTNHFEKSLYFSHTTRAEERNVLETRDGKSKTIYIHCLIPFLSRSLTLSVLLLLLLLLPTSSNFSFGFEGWLILHSLLKPRQFEPLSSPPFHPFFLSLPLSRVLFPPPFFPVFQPFLGRKAVVSPVSQSLSSPLSPPLSPKFISSS